MTKETTKITKYCFGKEDIEKLLRETYKLGNASFSWNIHQWDRDDTPTFQSITCETKEEVK